MPFLTRSDYDSVIQSEVFDSIIDYDDQIRVITETRVIQEMAGYLSARYDTQSIFSETGDDRNPVVVMYLVDMVLYHLHGRIAYNQVPEDRRERYRYAKEWLDGIRAGEINPPDLPVVPDGITDYVRFGGNEKRNNQF
jgi:phage gp36-like protein